MPGQTRDQQIGQNLAAMRGSASQQSVADAMRERGHKWSQSTVWSVEKGDRPLRFTEAQDLIRILGGQLWQLDRPNHVMRLLGAAELVNAAGDALVKAVYNFLSAKNELDWTIEQEELPADDDYINSRIAEAEDVEVDDAVAAGVARWEWISGGKEGDAPVQHKGLMNVRALFGGLQTRRIDVPEEDEGAAGD